MKKPVTLQEMAGVEFERFDDDTLAELLKMFGEDCLATFEPHFVALRIATRLLGLSKSELIERMCAIEDDAGVSLLEAFSSSAEFFTKYRSILESAQARVMICAAAAARDGGKMQ